MTEDFVASAPVQALLDRASGVDAQGGDKRLKAITRDLVEAVMKTIVRHEVSESEFWAAIHYFQNGAAEFGLIVPGVGLEHFMDLLMDARDAQAGRTGGTPRTIEGPLYVAGAPLVEGDVNLTDDADDTGTLFMSGTIKGPDGAPVEGATPLTRDAASTRFQAGLKTRFMAPSLPPAATCSPSSLSTTRVEARSRSASSEGPWA